MSKAGNWTTGSPGERMKLWKQHYTSYSNASSYMAHTYVYPATTCSKVWPCWCLHAHHYSKNVFWLRLSVRRATDRDVSTVNTRTRDFKNFLTSVGCPCKDVVIFSNTDSVTVFIQYSQ